ncbi:hydrogenase expression/formation protein HypE [uncultured Selenomonas sp.]|uniref:hydrogenase expression/formation protein HypE n=1 Tax=uncultured Selenomonas sp. TaxID=159275 RepID=UPI0025CFD355|nr:hydrogenase expression/formation protein HypE [uncultured Selenomonas sp.]
MQNTFSPDDRITLAHGAGGRKTSELIHDIFAKYFKGPRVATDDAAVVPVIGSPIAMTTDGFIVSPWRFPGGNIGKLSICGTVNDLACMGATPRFLTCAFQIEEGFPIADLDVIVASMAETCAKAHVDICAGDTKVAGKGQVDGLFITTTGIGEILPGIETSGKYAKPGDDILVSGDIGRHGAAILLARGDYGIDADITSDCAPLSEPILHMLRATGYHFKDVHTIRDATRGGVGTVLHEIASDSHVGIEINEPDIPVDPAVAGLTGLLGLSPLYLACEGRVVIICDPRVTPDVIQALQQHENTKGIKRIGTVTDNHAGHVMLKTEIGTEVLLPEPTGELLPRIC